MDRVPRVSSGHRKQRNKLTIPSTLPPSPDDEFEEIKKRLSQCMLVKENLEAEVADLQKKWATHYEMRLDNEIVKATAKSNAEHEKWESIVNDGLQREIRALRDSNAFLEKCRDDALHQVKDLETKYHSALVQMKDIQLNDSSRLAEFESQLKMKQFQVDRTSILLTDLEKRYENCSLEKQKLSEKLQVTQAELERIKIDSEHELNCLRLKLQEMSFQLAEYEKLEAFVDESVLNAAVLKADVEVTLKACSAGLVIPTCAKARLRQSVHLATKVLDLESRITDLKKALFEETDAKEGLSRQLNLAKKLFQNCERPACEFIELIWKRDVDMMKSNDTIDKLKAEIQELKASNEKLQTKLNKSSTRKEVSKKSGAARPEASPRDVVKENASNASFDKGLYFKKPLTFSKINKY